MEPDGPAPPPAVELKWFVLLSPLAPLLSFSVMSSIVERKVVEGKTKCAVKLVEDAKDGNNVVL